MLIPSIELSQGRAVRLRQGRELVLTSERDPTELVREFGRVGEVTVIDVDAARGEGDNLLLVQELCGLAHCRVGGGVRDVERAHRLLGAGARKLIIGTEAKPAFLASLPRQRVVVAVDAREDRVVDKGWVVEHRESPIQRAARLAPYVGGVHYTIVERSGTEAGTDFERVKALAAAVQLPMTVAGGIAKLDDVVALDRLGVDAQVGLALDRGRVSPAECLAAVVDFEKEGGGVPTVVQDARDGRVLLVGRSTWETLTEAVEGGVTILHARPSGRWRLGEASANTHRLVRVEVDCDRDALIFHVIPGGPSCDRGTASCFGERPFSLVGLEQTIDEHAASPDSASYARRLTEDVIERRAKIMEEASHLVDARAPEDVVREAADLIFHIMVDLSARGLKLADVIAELEARRK